MKSHILFKPYLYTISFLGISIAAWQLATVPMNLDLHLLIFILFNITAECYDHYYEDRHTSLTLGAANTFFMMVFFPFPAIALSCMLSVLMMAYIRKKKGLMKRVINEKTIYNMASYIIFNYVTYLAIRMFKINIPGNVLLIGVLVLFQNISNGVMVCAVQSLASGRSAFTSLFRDKSAYYTYTLILSLMLIYNYYYIGIFAVAGIYSIFITVQYSMQLAVDNKIKEEKIYKDNLTGAYNQECFLRTLDSKLRERKPFSLVFLDIDNFKNINDEYGHLAGDKALQEFAIRIKGMIRNEDILYRYGGDEFAVIVTDKNAARSVGSKLYDKKIEIATEAEIINIGFSTGIYDCTGLEASYEVILSRVDAAMYEAKQKGGNQIVYAGM